MEWNLSGLKRIDEGSVVAGVCSGIETYTPVPAWLCRAFFVATSFMGGIGFVIYLSLWVFMPDE